MKKLCLKGLKSNMLSMDDYRFASFLNYRKASLLEILVCPAEMDLLLPGSYARLSYTLIK